MLVVNNTILDLLNDVFILDIFTDETKIIVKVLEVGHSQSFSVDVNGDVNVKISLQYFDKKITIVNVKDEVLFELQFPMVNFIVNTSTSNLYSSDFKSIDLLETIEGNIATVNNPYPNDEYDRGLNDGLVLGQMI